MLIGSPPCAAIIHYIAYTVKIYVSISAYLYAALGTPRGNCEENTRGEFAAEKRCGEFAE
jgi:hypothetical protein